MFFDPSGTAGDGRLRLVFGTSVVSCDLAAHATYGDVARMLDETTRMRHGNPIAINVTLGCRPPPALRRGEGDGRVPHSL